MGSLIGSKGSTDLKVNVIFITGKKLRDKMGILDIIYAELNRYRDRKLSNEERKTAAHEAIKKILRKFTFDWKALREANPANLYAQGNNILKDYSSALVNVASEVSEIVETGELVKIASDMRKLAYSPPRGLGGGDEYMKEVNFISEKCGRLLQRV